MAIDIQAEHVLTLREAPGVLPSLRRGRPIHISTIYRWASRGVRGVRLETGRLGRTLVTSREALQRFADRLAALDRRKPGDVTRSSAKEARIKRELDRQGF
jgi:hypothetical protein